MSAKAYIRVLNFVEVQLINSFNNKKASLIKMLLSLAILTIINWLFSCNCAVESIQFLPFDKANTTGFLLRFNLLLQGYVGKTKKQKFPPDKS